MKLMLRNFLLLCAVVTLFGCSTAGVRQTMPVDLSKAPAVFVRISHDTENLAANLAQRIERLGFRTVPQEASADYVAEVRYTTFYDVVHQTFHRFEIVFVDKKTGVHGLKGEYIGRFGFNGVHAALDKVFKELARALKSGA
jgi:hypothetical protein